MERAASEEKKRRAAAGSNNGKRPPPTPSEQPSDAKRIKLENDASAQVGAPSILASFDFTTLPGPLITDLIVANLEAFSEPELVALVQAYRQLKGIPTSQPAAAPPAAPSSSASSSTISASPQKAVPTGPRKGADKSSTPVPRPATPPPEANVEVVDPLQMDIDEEEIEFEPERLNEEVNHSLSAKFCES